MYGILSDPTMPQGLLLDTIRHVETGGQPNPNYAMGSASELGAYQMRTDMLPDLGFGMPKDIDPFILMDPNKSRNLASQFIDSYSSYYGFDTPIEKLIAYNMGAPATAAWKARGSNFNDLPQTTQNYVKKALSFAQQQQPTEEDQPMNIQDIRNQVAATIANRNAARNARMSAAPSFADDMARNSTFPAIAPTQAGNIALTNVNQNAPGILAQQNANQNPAILNNYATAGIYDDPTLAIPVMPSIMLPNNSQMGRGFDAPIDAPPLATTNRLIEGGGGGNTTPNTDQARKQTPFSLPDQRIKRNEALIRIGGAMMGGARDGGLAALSAATDEYGAIQDDNRSQALEAYNAAVKAAKDNKAADPNAMSAYQQSTVDSIDEIVGLLDTTANNLNPFDNVAGLFGALKSNFPGNRAYDVNIMLDTIKANVGFDRLQAMRDASPTGGALGQVTEMELKLLQRSLAALDQGMSPDKFREALMRVRDHYTKVTTLLATPDTLENQMMAGTMNTDPDIQSLVDQYTQ